jgi:hypothetical protein
MSKESDYTPAALPPPTTQGDTNLTQPSSGEQPTSVESEQLTQADKLSKAQNEPGFRSQYIKVNGKIGHYYTTNDVDWYPMPERVIHDKLNPTKSCSLKTKLQQALFIDPRRPKTGAIWPLYPEGFDDTESDTPRPTPYDQLLALISEERRQAKIEAYEDIENNASGGGSWRRLITLRLTELKEGENTSE